jgi:hypothetical protein
MHQYQLLGFNLQTNESLKESKIWPCNFLKLWLKRSQELTTLHRGHHVSLFLSHIFSLLLVLRVYD